MMKSRKKWNGACAVVLAASIAITGCSGESGKESSNAEVKPVAAEAEATAGAKASSSGPLGKFDPAITITSARPVDGNFVFEKGEDISNNVWTREIEETLGIKMAYDWTTTKEEDYINKLNVSIASGEKLPDLYQVGPTQLKQLVEADQLADLTDVYEQYVAPMTKEFMQGDGGIGLDSATFNGKLMAIPELQGKITGTHVLWLRTDWLEKLNLEAPKSVDDLIKIAEAFKTQDPDGNGKDDTYGLGLSGMQPVSGGVAGLGGFFAGYGAYPQQWIKDDSGKLAHGSIQPEVKEALSALADMYKEGLIDREFALKDGGKIGEDIINTRLGMFYGPNWAPYYPMDISKNELLVNMTPYSIVSKDGSQPVVQSVDFSVSKYFVVRKGFEHPEAVVKLLNIFQERLFGETADLDKFSSAPGIEYFKYPLVQSSLMDKDVPVNVDAVREAQKTADASKLNNEQRIAYDNIKAYEAGDLVKGWGTVKQFEAFDIIKKDNYKNLKNSEFYGAQTSAMVDFGSSLYKLELEVYTKIVMGESPVSAFDAFVADWKKLGGDQMTQEVNDWANNR